MNQSGDKSLKCSKETSNGHRQFPYECQSLFITCFTSSCYYFNQILQKTNPVSSNWQWMCCVHVLLPIVARLAVSKDLHLEVPHHGVHHLPGGNEDREESPQPHSSSSEDLHLSRLQCLCTLSGIYPLQR